MVSDQGLEKTYSGVQKVQMFPSLNSPASSNTLPIPLIRAKAAVEAGQIARAAVLIDDQVIESVRQMPENDPFRREAMLLLAVVLNKISRFDEAEHWYLETAQKYSSAAAYDKLGCLCQHSGRLTQAVQYHKKATEIDPSKMEFWGNFARAMIETGKVQQGIDLLRQVILKIPDNAEAFSNYLFRQHYLPQPDRQTLFQEHKKWAQIHAPTSMARTSHSNCPNPDRKIRIGYISPDFKQHPVAFFFEPLLDGHDRDQLEIFGYGNVASPDQTTERLEAKFDHYRNIYATDDNGTADLIEQDQIDILVDLAGHTADNRLFVMARKPAPVQVSYLGYPDTTGLDAIDYRFTDTVTDSADSQQFYTEQLIFLPDTFACYRPAGFAGPVVELPAAEKGYITFGSFNNNCKINPFVLSLWAQVLRACDKSRIVLRFKGGDDPGLKAQYIEQFQQLQISEDRVDITGWRNITEHMKLYNQIDIALDTYPANGHTTTCDALWMGVPVISFVGDSHISRFGLSVLKCVGLEFFATSTTDEYVQKAVALAANIESLAEIRTAMRARIAASGLCYAQGFARNVECAYRRIWRRWCQQQNSGADEVS